MGFRLHSYVVARDFGFAPNPFGGFCTLATCKPVIRRVAQVGDWIVGTGGQESSAHGRLIFAMKVDGAMTFSKYWEDARFQNKRPIPNGSLKRAFGDNIYFRDGATWHQANSHHSLPDGSPNALNIANDTSTDRILWGRLFGYWGGSGPDVPSRFRSFNGVDLCSGRGHQNNKLEEMKHEVVEWLRGLGLNGFLGEPTEWQWANSW